MNASHLPPGLISLLFASAAVASPAASAAGNIPAKPARAASAQTSAAACLPIVDKAWIRAAPPGSEVLAGYARVRNDCAKAAAVASARSTDFGGAMLHATQQSGGMSMMREADSLEVPARGELRFAPGGNHIMLMQPRRALKAGDHARIELVLSDGRTIAADFVVRRDAP
ncbi:hypothetical protein BH11PSE14_BH11PSE14_11700 [soil metagenome]